MVKEMIFGTIGGLSLFLFGMGLMSNGLKKIAGQKLKSLLEALTKHRGIAVLVGALTTCLIQSSSATTVLKNMKVISAASSAIRLYRDLVPKIENMHDPDKRNVLRLPTSGSPQLPIRSSLSWRGVE